MVINIFVILVTINLVSYSQFDTKKETLYSKAKFSIGLLKYDAISSYNTGLKLLQAPIQFDQNDLILTGFVIAMTGAASSLDNRVRLDSKKAKSKTMDRFAGIGEKFGSGLYGGAFSVLLYASGHFFSDKKLRDTGQMLIEAMVCNGLITQTLKIAIGRSRPYLGGNNTNFDILELEFKSSENSFPSGHTSTAFTFATVLSERIDNIYASIALYSLASLAGYQRIYSDAHWLSDTVLGAAIGTFVGLKIVSLHEEDKSSVSNFDLKIFPQVGLSSYGIGFALQF